MGTATQPWPLRRAWERRYAELARETAATAEVIALSWEHLAEEPPVSKARSGRLQRAALAEHGEARRLWVLADGLDPYRPYGRWAP